jgi:hypothetical protein
MENPEQNEKLQNFEIEEINNDTQKQENITVTENTPENNSQNVGAVPNPYATTKGKDLISTYNFLMAQRQNLDYYLYYLNAEIQGRLAYVNQYGLKSMPFDMIPMMPGMEDEHSNSVGKIIIKEEPEAEGPVKKHILLAGGYTAQQKRTDEIIKKYLKDE